MWAWLDLFRKQSVSNEQDTDIHFYFTDNGAVRFVSLWLMLYMLLRVCNVWHKNFGGYTPASLHTTMRSSQAASLGDSKRSFYEYQKYRESSFHSCFFILYETIGEERNISLMDPCWIAVAVVACWIHWRFLSLHNLLDHPIIPIRRFPTALSWIPSRYFW